MNGKHAFAAGRLTARRSEVRVMDPRPLCSIPGPWVARAMVRAEPLPAARSGAEPGSRLRLVR